MLAAELGVMTVRLERAVRSLDGVARVHVNRWGDGAAHLQLWFMARPYGRLQLRGTFLTLWDEILPSIPESQWRENLALVAAWLAEFGGQPLAQPPRIDWKAPASYEQAIQTINLEPEPEPESQPEAEPGPGSKLESEPESRPEPPAGADPAPESAPDSAPAAPGAGPASQPQSAAARAGTGPAAAAAAAEPARGPVRG
jgi:hypothetical protein